MIKEAIEFIATLRAEKNPVTVEVKGQHYSVQANGTLGIPILPVPETDTRHPRPTLKIATLSGLVAAYKAKIDELGGRAALIIADHRNVVLQDLDCDKFGKRQLYVHARHEEKSTFEFGKYYNPEDFLLAFRASFIFNENAVNLQKICSTIGAGDAVIVADDGVSQEVTTKSGTLTKSAIALPPDGVALIPWRTFRDANPIEAKFLLRMRSVKDGLPQIALFEIDPMWELYTVLSVRKYLHNALPEAVIIA